MSFLLRKSEGNLVAFSSALNDLVWLLVDRTLCCFCTVFGYW